MDLELGLLLVQIIAAQSPEVLIGSHIQYFESTQQLGKG